MRTMIGFDLGKLRLGAHCVGWSFAVGRICTWICVLILCVLWSAGAHGSRVHPLNFGSRYDLRLGIPIIASVN